MLDRRRSNEILLGDEVISNLEKEFALDELFPFVTSCFVSRKGFLFMGLICAIRVLGIENYQ
jgi:hypothetical protein